MRRLKQAPVPHPQPIDAQRRLHPWRRSALTRKPRPQLGHLDADVRPKETVPPALARPPKAMAPLARTQQMATLRLRATVQLGALMMAPQRAMETLRRCQERWHRACCRGRRLVRARHQGPTMARWLRLMVVAVARPAWSQPLRLLRHQQLLTLI